MKRIFSKLIIKIFLKFDSLLFQAYERVKINLGRSHGETNIQNYKDMSTIAGVVCKEGGVAHPNPLGI